MAQNRVVFFSRNAVVDQRGGSTTVAINLLSLLARHDAEIVMVVTSAYGRSPGLYFRERVALPSGVRLVAPGFVRLGPLYLNLFSVRAWLRAGCRLMTRSVLLSRMIPAVLRVGRGSVVAEAWDLTTPTEAEVGLCRRVVAEQRPEVILVNYAFWAPMFERLGVEGRGPKRVILMHDLLSARIAKFVASGMELDCPYIAEATEMEWLSKADFVLAAQRTEAEHVAALTSAKVLVQPIVLEVRESGPKPDAFRCLFVGTGIPPNIDGIRWFLKEVWPRVLEGNPEASLYIAGTVCGVLEGEEYRNVHLQGVVPSLKEEMERAGVCLAPLRVGSGIKVKLLEALAFGKACVATSIGVQGLEGWVEGVLEVADEPGDFAAAVLRLMFDAELRGRREDAGRKLIRRRFSAESEPARVFAAAVLGEEGTGNRA